MHLVLLVPYNGLSRITMTKPSLQKMLIIFADLIKNCEDELHTDQQSLQRLSSASEHLSEIIYSSAKCLPTVLAMGECELPDKTIDSILNLIVGDKADLSEQLLENEDIKEQLRERMVEILSDFRNGKNKCEHYQLIMAIFTSKETSLSAYKQYFK